MGGCCIGDCCVMDNPIANFLKTFSVRMEDADIPLVYQVMIIMLKNSR